MIANVGGRATKFMAPVDGRCSQVELLIIASITTPLRNRSAEGCARFGDVKPVCSSQCRGRCLRRIPHARGARQRVRLPCYVYTVKNVVSDGIIIVRL